jgi:hypothetical protein
MLDASVWYSEAGAFSQANVANFFNTAQLHSETRWILSPLFLIESVIGSSSVLHYGYLIVGIALCIASMAGRGGRWVNWALWIVFAGWANRILFLSGPTEILLSLSLFAIAIAPPAAAWGRKQTSGEENDERHWSAGLASRLLAVQITLFGLLTFATMMAQDAWWNGYAAYAMNAPTEDRTIDLTGFLSPTIVHEVLTHFLALALPIGLWLAWKKRSSENRLAGIGIVLLVTWCVLIALLGSHWLYAATFATGVFSITLNRDHVIAKQ